MELFTECSRTKSVGTPYNFLIVYGILHILEESPKCDFAEGFICPSEAAKGSSVMPVTIYNQSAISRTNVPQCALQLCLERSKVPYALAQHVGTLHSRKNRW